MKPATVAEKLGQEVERRTLRSIATPDGVAVTVAIGDIGSRVAAAVIDLIIVAVVSDLLLILFAVLSGALISWPGYVSYRSGDLIVVAGIFIGFLVRMIYFPAMEYASRGQTFGKRVLGLRVISKTGATLSLESILVRNFVREIEFWMPITLLVVPLQLGQSLGANVWGAVSLLALAVLPLTNSERMRGGDMLAGTWVVAEPNATLLPDLAKTVRTFTREELTQYGVFELETLATVLREQGPNAISLHRKVAERIRRRIGRAPAPGERDRTFLEDFYSALRDHLERQKVTTGEAPETKDDARGNGRRPRR
ncbi:MAG: RDD family protein [Pseudomonadota bacterium]